MTKNVLIIFLFLFFNNTIKSQDTSEQIENSISNLKEKLLLSEDQVESIQKIIVDFLNLYSKTETDSIKVINDTNNKIESYLDRKQKIKFDVIKKDWWEKFFEKVINININDNL